MISVSEEQLLNAPLRISATFFPNVTSTRFLQLQKASISIVVTPLPIVASVRFEQLKKASDPMVLTESGIVTDVKALFSLNALLPITVTGLPPISLGIFTSFTVVAVNS